MKISKLLFNPCNIDIAFYATIRAKIFSILGFKIIKYTKLTKKNAKTLFKIFKTKHYILICIALTIYFQLNSKFLSYSTRILSYL